jgi:hypothetical protein
MISVTVALGLTRVPLRLAVRPGVTDVVRLTLDLNPFNPITAMSEGSEEPGRIVSEAGVAEIVKSAAKMGGSMMAGLESRVFVASFVSIE